MRRRPGPLRCLRRWLPRPMGLHPATRQHPASVANDAHAGLGRLPSCGPLQHLVQALATTRSVVQKVSHPGVDVLARDLCPGLSVPSAEIGLQQGVIDHVSPAQAAQVTANVAAAPEGRGADHLRQALLQRMPMDATRQAPGLSRVDLQVGAPDAASCMADGAWVAPGGESHERVDPAHATLPHELTRPPGAPRATRPARWQARRVAGWHPGCHP